MSPSQSGEVLRLVTELSGPPLPAVSSCVTKSSPLDGRPGRRPVSRRTGQRSVSYLRPPNRRTPWLALRVGATVGAATTAVNLKDGGETTLTATAGLGQVHATQAQLNSMAQKCEETGQSLARGMAQLISRT